jgi:hypothetical protein
MFSHINGKIKVQNEPVSAVRTGRIDQGGKITEQHIGINARLPEIHSQF